MNLGIDFGTTHTSAAWHDGQKVHFVPLDLRNDNPALLRSMIYITCEQHSFLRVEQSNVSCATTRAGPLCCKKKWWARLKTR